MRGHRGAGAVALVPRKSELDESSSLCIFRVALPYCVIYHAGETASKMQAAAEARRSQSNGLPPAGAPRAPTDTAPLLGSSDLAQDPSGSSETAVDGGGSKKPEGAVEGTLARTTPPPAAAAAAAVGARPPAAAVAAGAQQVQAQVVQGAADRNSAETHHAAILSIPGSHVDGRDSRRDHLSDGKCEMQFRNNA